MSGKNTFCLRYPADMQDQIEEIANLTNYGMSKNKGIVFAIKLAHQIIRKSKGLKANKTDGDVISHIEKKYGVTYQQWY